MRRLLFSLVLLVPMARAEQLTVCAAVSLKEAMEEVGKTYHKEAGVEVKFVFGASGTLEAQIRNGAPADAFISAADQQVKNLIDRKLADESSRRVIARNSLVVIVPADRNDVPKDLDALKNQSFKKIAIGDPKIVPAGQYASQALKSAKIDKMIADKIMYGASVRQVLAYVERGEVDAGLVYATDARQARDKVKIAFTIDPSLHDPIEYPAVLLKDAPQPEAARKFIEFLSSEKAQSILKAKGFKPIEDKRK